MLAGLAAICLGVGCHKEMAKHYAVSGEVISVDVLTQMIMLKHGDIPGLMPAMTMEYKVADAKQMAELRPGDTISADLVVGENIGHLEKVVVIGKALPAPSTSDEVKHRRLAQKLAPNGRLKKQVLRTHNRGGMASSGAGAALVWGAGGGYTGLENEKAMEFARSVPARSGG